MNIYGEILQEQTLPKTAQDNDILFRNPISKEPLAFFDGNSGDLSIKGLVIHNGYYDGMSVDENAFNSNCTTTDNYTTVSGIHYWRDYYCDRTYCVYKNEDLDLSKSLCLGDNLNWNIGGNTNPTTCCGDDPNEFNLTRKCNSGCLSNSTDDACCDNSNDAVIGSNCFTEGSKICSPNNPNYVIEANSGEWDLLYNCTKQCYDSCNAFTTCKSGSCDSPIPVSLGKNCTSGIGEVNLGICDSDYACSNANGNLIYNDGGNWSCQATCDGSGGCTHATNCIDCSQIGSVNGCACACDGYGVQENISNGNTCNDGLDNDCDGNVDNQDSDCCHDEDGDGWGTEATYLNCPNHTTWDCDDHDGTNYPENTEICNDGKDNNCDGKVDCADSDCVSACTFVIVNSATGKTCDNLCSNNGAVCLSTGTDSLATNKYFWTAQNSGTYCYRTQNTYYKLCDDIVYASSYDLICSGYKTQWTHCKCQKFSGPAP